MTKGNPDILQKLDPRIDKTFHRGVRHHRNPSLHLAYFVTFPYSYDTCKTRGI